MTSKPQPELRIAGTLRLVAALAATLGVAACSTPETPPGDPSGGNADDDDSDESIPTPGLRMLADIRDQDTLETLFHSSTLDEQDTINAVLAEMAQRNASAIRIKAEGIPVFTDLIEGIDFDSRLGTGLTGFARNIWSGKVFTFRQQPDGALMVTLQNAILGTEFVDAVVTIATLSDAMQRRGEETPGEKLEKFGINEPSVSVDDKLSVILDYELERISLFSSLIDEIRPVTSETMAAAGLEPMSEAELTDLWIGRATALSGVIDKDREFFLYFALDFDRASIEVIDGTAP